MCISVISYTQSDTTQSKPLLLKIFTNIICDQNNDLTYENGLLLDIYEKSCSIGKISFGLEQKFNENWSQEIELMIFNIGSTYYEQIDYDREEFTITTSSNSQKAFNINLLSRYQVQYHFLNSESRLRPFLGATTGLRYNCILTRPLENSNYPTNTSIFTIPFEVVTGLDFRLSKKIGLNIQIPIEINHFIIEAKRIKDPSTPTPLQRTSSIFGILIPKSFNLKFGLTYNL